MHLSPDQKIHGHRGIQILCKGIIPKEIDYNTTDPNLFKISDNFKLSDSSCSSDMERRHQKHGRISSHYNSLGKIMK